MANVRKKLTNAFLALIICVGALIIWHSYQPSARYSTVIGNDRSRTKFECIYNSQAQIEAPANVLIFGSSRAGAYFDDRIISRWTSEFSGQPQYVQNLNIAGGDASLSYQFLKEYLEKNTPDLIYVEALRIKPQVSLIPYVNRSFSSTADWSLTRDLLRDFDDGRNGFFRAADMSRIMIDKTDKYISKALVREYSTTVKNKEACIRNKAIDRLKFEAGAASKNKFTALYKRELANMTKNIKVANNIRKETNIARRERALKKYRETIGKDWETAEAEDWGYSSDVAKRQIFYYNKISELAADKGVKLVYFRPYGLYESEFPTEQIESYEALLGGEIISPPYKISKLAYPYYVDPNHAGKQSKRLFALWLSEDILTRMGKF